MTTITTSATYKTQITSDLPDWGAADVTFELVASFFNGSGEEVIAGKTYVMTLDAAGNDSGSFYLPTPDNTGDAGVNWRLTLPSGHLVVVTVAYSASAQSVSDLIAAGSTTTDPDVITAALASKQAKDPTATDGYLAIFASGQTVAGTGAPGTAAYAATGDFDAAGSAAAAQAAAIAALDGGGEFGVIDSTKTIRAGEYRTKPRTAQALVTIMFDDGTATDYTLMLPLFQSKGIVGASAIITDYPDVQPGYMTWAQILLLDAAGWEIVSHGKTAVRFDTMTEAELNTELTNTQADFLAHGLTPLNLVYPEHGSNEMVRRISRNYYRSARGQAGFSGTNRINLELLETFNLRSVNIDDHTQLASYKSAVDDAETLGQWVIFYAHGTTADDVTAIGELIDYIQAKSISIVTPNQALNILGNDIDLSEYVAFRDNAARLRRVYGNLGIGVEPEGAFHIGVSETLVDGKLRGNYLVGGTTNTLLESKYTSWTYPKFALYADGKIEWGAGSATALDTNLYRLSANNLKTDDNLTIAGNLTVGIGLVTNMRANTNAFPANKVNIAPAGTAVLTINFSTTYPTGFARVYCTVYYSSSTNLQSHLTYQLLTVETAATGGGGIAIQQLHNDSAGNFLVQTSDFVVTRPANGRIVITYTNGNPSGNNNIYFFVEGVSISDVSIA